MNGAPVARIASTCFERNLLDRLGEELGDEADRGHRQREDAGERAEAHRLHEQDRDDHLVKRAAQRDEEPHRPGDPGRHQVARREEPDRQREQDAERGGDDRDLERLVEPARHQRHLVRRGVRRQHAADELDAVLEPEDEAVPGDVEYRRRVERVGRQREPGEPRRPVRQERRGPPAPTMLSHARQLSLGAQRVPGSIALITRHALLQPVLAAVDLLQVLVGQRPRAGRRTPRCRPSCR